MPPGLRRKSMAVGTRAAITIASWPAPLGICLAGKPSSLDCLGQKCREALVHRHSRLIHLREFDAVQDRAASGDGLRPVASSASSGFIARGVLGVPHVEAQTRTAPGITLPALGSHDPILPTVATRPSVRLRKRFHGADPFRRAGQSIAPQAHGRGAGMVGMAGKL